MDDANANLIAENKALTKGRRPIVERVIGVPTKIETSVKSEGDAAAAGSLYGIVGEVDRVNANRRAYPRKEWVLNIDRQMEAAKSRGGMLGAVDHQGCMEGGNLKSSPIVWQSMEILSDGRVAGTFKLADTAAGRDLQALIDAKGKVGFSTYGYAESHFPSDEERQQYGMPAKEADAEDGDDGYVVIDNWDLVKIDAVDNPSVRSAWLQQKESNSTGEQMFKTLEEMKAGCKSLLENAKHAVVAEADIAAKDADLAAMRGQVTSLESEVASLKAAVADAQPKLAKYESICTKLGESLKCLGEEHGIAVYREVTDADAQRKVDDAVAAKAAAETKITALEAQVADAVAKAAEAKAALQAKEDRDAAAAANAERIAKATAKFNESTATHKHRKALVVAFESALKAGDFVADSVDAFVAAKSAEYDLLAPSAKPESDVLSILGQVAPAEVAPGATGEEVGEFDVAKLAESL